MDKFEHQFETLDVQTQQMEDTMSNTTTLTTPQVRILNENFVETAWKCYVLLFFLPAFLHLELERFHLLLLDDEESSSSYSHKCGGSYNCILLFLTFSRTDFM